MFIKPLFLFFVVGAISSTALCDLYRPNFQDVPMGQPTDLLKETNSLRLQKENSVQIENPPSKYYVTAFVGTLEPSMLAMSTTDRTVVYNFGKPLLLGSFQVTHYPWTFKYGKLGWTASVGYAYGEYDTAQTPATALHIIPVEALATFRFENSDKQKFIPLFMAGPAVWSVFQRGLDLYNTSTASLVGVASAGVAFNLNRAGIINSRNDTEIVLQYQRHFAPVTDASNLNSDVFEIGGAIAL